MDIQSAYTRLLVRDLKACFLFYRDVLGFEVAVNDEKGGYAELKAGNVKLSLFNRQEMAEMIDNDHLPPHTESQDDVALIFVVPDLDEAYQQLQHKEAKFITPPMAKPYYGIKTAYLRDPDGTLIGLYQTLL